MNRKTTAMALAVLALGTAAPAAADHHMEAAAHQPIAQALQAEIRSEDKARDMWRHPAETLDFFKVEPGMTVADYMPAGGYYTRILVPYLGTQGRYIGLSPDPAAADAPRFAEYFTGLPGKFSEESKTWALDGAPIAVYASGDLPEAMNGQLDRVLIFREMHNILRSGALYTELMRIRSALKDDGMLGIVQHRAKADAPGSYTTGGKGYLRQKDVVALVEAHGFELVAESEINANPKDTADHEDGVWQLPPSMRGNDESKRAIGESDRMTLLFRKRA
ncbi:class I SAM-dependent methyltransferase [Qipengyuania sp.]|uniref:class I SAM-dependent methyltransferase n=1 Tax=Qipengyuania sp. TaxID=2004515 RepID=UPI0035C7DB74